MGLTNLLEQIQAASRGIFSETRGLIQSEQPISNDSVTPNVLNKWDVVTSTWDVATPFYIDATDPTLLPTLAAGTLWLNPTTGVMNAWNGSSWTSTAYISATSDPTMETTGIHWFKAASISDNPRALQDSRSKDCVRFKVRLSKVLTRRLQAT